MTDSVLKEIVQRAVRDGSFRAQLRSDPAKALAGFNITAEERSAVTTGDPARLTALGVDQRMSKAYSAGLLSDASKVVASTDATKGVADFIDEGTTGGTAVIVGDPTAGVASPATLVHDIQSFSDLHMKLSEQDLNVGAAAVDADAGTVRSPGFLTQDEELLASRPEPAGTEHSPLWKIEQDLDAGASLEAPPAGDAPQVEITGDDSVSEY